MLLKENTDIPIFLVKEYGFIFNVIVRFIVKAKELMHNSVFEDLNNVQMWIPAKY